MNIDPPKLETAEERAMRIWRNNQIIRQLANEEAPEITNTPMQQSFKFKKAILEIFATKRNETLTNYIAAIKHRKRQLMLEKLRRMERDNDQKI